VPATTRYLPAAASPGSFSSTVYHLRLVLHLYLCRSAHFCLLRFSWVPLGVLPPAWIVLPGLHLPACTSGTPATPFYLHPSYHRTWITSCLPAPPPGSPLTDRRCPTSSLEPHRATHGLFSAWHVPFSTPLMACTSSALCHLTPHSLAFPL